MKISAISIPFKASQPLKQEEKPKVQSYKEIQDERMRKMEEERKKKQEEFNALINKPQKYNKLDIKA